jgi:hypothetical protein
MTGVLTPKGHLWRPPILFRSNNGADPSARDTYGLGGRPALRDPREASHTRPARWALPRGIAPLDRGCGRGKWAAHGCSAPQERFRSTARAPYVTPMSIGSAEVDVMRFLRAALAGQARAVTELEASARAAGLLSDRQSITLAKAFRRAKKALRIKSRRAGFGARSEWLWELPGNDQSTELPRPEQSSALAGDEELSELPRNEQSSRRPAKPAPLVPNDWVTGIDRLDPNRPPADVPRHRWRQFIDDCERFMSSSENWAARAHQLSWDAHALFGCAPKRPLDYSGSAGLLWAIAGGRLVELHRDWAVIDLPVNRSQRIFYRRNVDPAKITLPWVKQASFR